MYSKLSVKAKITYNSDEKFHAVFEIENLNVNKLYNYTVENSDNALLCLHDTYGDTSQCA